MRLALVLLSVGSCLSLNFAGSFGELRAARRGTRGTTLVALGGLFESFMGKKTFEGSCVMGEESIMAPKEHGTSAKPVQGKLRWSCKDDLADRICSFNRSLSPPSRSHPRPALTPAPP